MLTVINSKGGKQFACNYCLQYTSPYPNWVINHIRGCPFVPKMKGCGSCRNRIDVDGKWYCGADVIEGELFKDKNYRRKCYGWEREHLWQIKEVVVGDEFVSDEYSGKCKIIKLGNHPCSRRLLFDEDVSD